MKVKLKNGMIGNLVGDVHIIFDNGDTYSYTVPANDIVEEVKNEKKIKGSSQTINYVEQQNKSNVLRIDFFKK